jgi:exodeoxyribonuclease III
VVHNIPGFADDMARVITGTVNGVRVVGAYFPNGQAPDSDKFVYKMAWLTALHGWLKDELTRHDKLVLMGDYNITWDDRDVWDPVALAGTIHCTDEERAHFQSLIDLGLHGRIHRLFEQAEKSYSWWDYREFAFRRNRGLRIDHILVSNQLVPRLNACTIDKAPRKNERPSDHTPVVVTSPKYQLTLPLDTSRSLNRPIPVLGFCA